MASPRLGDPRLRVNSPHIDRDATGRVTQTLHSLLHLEVVPDARALVLADELVGGVDGLAPVVAVVALEAEVPGGRAPVSTVEAVALVTTDHPRHDRGVRRVSTD